MPPQLLKVFHLLPTSLWVGFAGLFLLWLLVQLLSHLMRRQVRTTVDPVDEVMQNLGCGREQAAALLEEYHGDLARAIMDVRLGKRALPTPCSASGGFAVVLDRRQTKDLIPMGQLLAQVSGLPQPEALKLLSPGSTSLLAQGLNEELAHAFREALEKTGVKAAVLSAEALPQARFGGDVRSLEIGSALVLDLGSEGGQPESIPWEALEGLCVGVLEADTRPTSDGTVPAGRGELIAHLYAGGFRYRLRPRKINFSTLGERKRDSSVTNLQVLVQELLEAASPQLVTNLGVERLISDLRATAYKSEEEMVADGISLLAAAAAEKIGK